MLQMREPRVHIASFCKVQAVAEVHFTTLPQRADGVVDILPIRTPDADRRHLDIGEDQLEKSNFNAYYRLQRRKFKPVADPGVVPRS